MFYCQMKNKSIKTPRPYLSWSQMNLIERNPEAYIKTYFQGYKFENEAMRLGKEVAEILEMDKICDNTMIENMRIMLPSYEKREFEIKTEKHGIQLLGKLDCFNRKGLVIGEIKTGKKWTQKMVDEHGQLTFYALLVYLKYKKLPSKIYLHWAKTAEIDEELQLTGEIKTFETKRDLLDILKFTSRIKNAWAEIEKLSKIYAEV